MATSTYGNAAPSDIILNLDSVIALSLANYSKTLTDNIGASNPFLHELMSSDSYVSIEGGINCQEPLMYALTPMRWYNGSDVLSTSNTDGITNAVYDWTQAAAPIEYTMRDVIINRLQIADLVKSKIKQAEMGIQEGWANAFMHGSGNGALATPVTEVSNGALGIDPIGKIISATPTSSLVFGNINQSTSSWWQNKVANFSSVTNYSNFVLALDNLYNTCALGSGGEPNLMITDQITYQLIVAAYYFKYRQTSERPQNYPFMATMFKQAKLVMEEKTPDAANGLINTNTAGTIYVMNTKFFNVKYIQDRNWVLLKDQAGNAFTKPPKQDTRSADIAWMGTITCSNRRKQGVGFGIPRTLLAA